MGEGFFVITGDQNVGVSLLAMAVDQLIVPTLRVGMQPGTLRVPRADAERPVRHSHAERGNDQVGGVF